MKNKFILTAILCFQIAFLVGQTIVCTEHISDDRIHREELLAAIEMYRDRGSRSSALRRVYLVDFFQENSLNQYRIISCLWPNAPLFRQPDCIVRLDSFSIALLYTPYFRKPKDSLFLDILEREMSSVFNQTMGYCWETLIMDTNVRVALPGSFSPPIIQYTFREGRLIEITEFRWPYNRMYYEDLHIPPNWNCREFCPRCSPPPKTPPRGRRRLCR